VRAVLDANVLVSALIRPQGPPGSILLRLLRDGAFDLVASPAILDELRRAIRYPRVRKYLHGSEEDLDLHVEALQAVAIMVEGRSTGRIVAADPADDIYVAAAAEGLAEYIVSGDRHLLDLGGHEGIRILTPREFLDLLEH
jgi:putative PIN family toxin of toxin-antitoxin system